MVARGDYSSPFVDPVHVFLVRGLGDLPEPVANVISIPTAHTVFAETSFDLKDNQMVFDPGSTFSGYSGVSSVITGTHPESLVDITGGALVENITLKNTVGAGLTLDNAFAELTTQNMTFDSCDLKVFDFSFLKLSTASFLNGQLSFNQTPTSPVAQFLCETSNFLETIVMDSISVRTGVVIPIFRIASFTRFLTISGGTGISLNDFDTQVIDGVISESLFAGAGNPFENFDQTSPNWQVFNNLGITDSCDQGTTNFDSVGGETVTIDEMDEWVDIADGGINISYSLLDNPEKFVLTDANTGEMAYNSVREKCFKPNGHVNLRGMAGTVNIEVGISLNGADPVESTRGSAIVSNTRREAVTIGPVPIRMLPTDAIKLQMRNRTNTDNIVVFQSKETAYF